MADDEKWGLSREETARSPSGARKIPGTATGAIISSRQAATLPMVKKYPGS